MRLDNHGEGGIVALLALLRQKRRRGVLLALGLFGAALLYGDGVITPAISVLSAAGGLEVVTPAFKPYVLPSTLLILFLLFFVQKYGTARVGGVFAPIMLVWFGTIATLGTLEIVRAPAILLAVNPWYGIQFFREHGLASFLVLGSVVLAVTGAEALYADMGHFGRTPIRLAWFGVVFPRSEEHTSELQSRLHLVCRLLLEKKKNKEKKNLGMTTRHYGKLVFRCFQPVNA